MLRAMGKWRQPARPRSKRTPACEEKDVWLHKLCKSSHRTRQGSVISHATSTGGRKGRKRYSRKHPSETSIEGKPSSQSQNRKVTYYCTVCRKGFRGCYDWKRHEATHFDNIQKWICMPENTAIHNSTCAFCESPQPNSEHFKGHRVHDCLQRPLAERTFGRKDLLKQHIKDWHLDKKPPMDQKGQDEILARWFKDTDPAELSANGLWCGFCETILHTLTERVDHITEHYRNGWHIVLWTTLSDACIEGDRMEEWCLLCYLRVPVFNAHIVRVTLMRHSFRHENDMDFLDHLRNVHAVNTDNIDNVAFTCPLTCGHWDKSLVIQNPFMGIAIAHWVLIKRLKVRKRNL
ncbi:hypothetical protein NA57DRAFT_55550 [Rhizodiscina lignyota]|uniref:C2H2-type domain-containing protein n=1 Tax=Rhizodiscina lignyota TaxID=1504668 RepID=A0A9P4M6C6_9PEZI|nr:hypothetical protein NA57DRAFT_55550 [Rhizodiscina lignyota]